MEKITGTGVLIMVIIFTCINLYIFRRRRTVIYFSSEARMQHTFRKIFLVVLFSMAEVGIIIKLFSGILGVILAILKFILMLILILAAAGVVITILAKVVPIIIPKSKPALTKLSTYISEKTNAFKAKRKKENEEEADRAQEESSTEDDANANDASMNICSKCGSPLAEGDLFCQECGAKVSNETCERGNENEENT